MQTHVQRGALFKHKVTGIPAIIRQPKQKMATIKPYPARKKMETIFLISLGSKDLDYACYQFSSKILTELHNQAD